MTTTLQRFLLSLAPLFAESAMAQAPATPLAEAPQSTAAADERKAAHGLIREERAALKVAQRRDEEACYQRFAVEDCLRTVRARVREAEARLRAQELQLNDAERREKAAARLRAIEENQALVPAQPVESNVTDTPSRRPAPVTQTQRDSEAAQRAEQQRSRVQAQTQDQARRRAESAQRAAEARERHADRLKAAEERRARAEKTRADAQAQGRPVPAPLPSASTAR